MSIPGWLVIFIFSLIMKRVLNFENKFLHLLRSRALYYIMAFVLYYIDMCVILTDFEY